MEKTGATVKKLHDFDTSGALEVCIKGNWYRTTCNDFRSFDGKRRITQPIKQPGVGESFSFLLKASRYPEGYSNSAFIIPLAILSLL